MEQITSIGLVLLIVLTAVKEIFSWLKQKNLLNQEQRLLNIEETNRKQDEKMAKILLLTEELYEWHDKDDQDGVKIWYIRQSLEGVLRENAQAISVLAKNSELQTNLLKEMIDGQKAIMREHMSTSSQINLLLRDKEK